MFRLPYLLGGVLGGMNMSIYGIYVIFYVFDEDFSNFVYMIPRTCILYNIECQRFGSNFPAATSDVKWGSFIYFFSFNNKKKKKSS